MSGALTVKRARATGAGDSRPAGKTAARWARARRPPEQFVDQVKVVVQVTDTGELESGPAGFLVVSGLEAFAGFHGPEDVDPPGMALARGSRIPAMRSSLRSLFRSKCSISSPAA
jgi:hypothetical protein